ncbi:response regulator [Desulfitibacter alkalitolerans]|uniref:response regulator n=1 Tax=Desulfitibacter alkalitolerans TaxID=264641 RepID=UPI00048981A4|nr:response regulator transcription factor [Desulfitibacter alkalitolerans]
MKTIKVLLVDDHPLITEGLEKILSFDDAIQVVGKANDGDQAIEIAKDVKPDVVVMDINMPGIDGIEACMRIRDMLPGTEVIALTVCEEEDRILQILKAGAKGYFLKDVETERLIDAIKNVQKGQSFIHPQIAAKVLNSYTTLASRQNRDFKGNELTDRELELVKLMAKGLSNKEIASALYISEKTVKNHITNILRKLDLRDRVQVAIWAIKEKLI